MLTQSVESAIRAVLYLASQGNRFVPVAEIARAVRSSRTYLAKMLAQLVTAGILDSSRGTTGGYRLARPSETIALAEIAAALEGTEPRRCLLGQGVCGEVPGCVAHQRWAPVADAVNGFFSGTTVSDLLHSQRSLP